MSSLKEKKLFLLDMDGTIYLDDDLFDGTLDFLAYVKSIGGRYLFLTNNSSKGVDKYIEKLARLGIESVADDFLTSTEATIAYLRTKNHRKIYAFGTESFRRQLSAAGFNVTDHIAISISGSKVVTDIALSETEEISSDTLADSLEICEPVGFAKEWDINGESVTIGIKKI